MIDINSRQSAVTSTIIKHCWHCLWLDSRNQCYSKWARTSSTVQAVVDHPRRI